MNGRQRLILCLEISLALTFLLSGCAGTATTPLQTNPPLADKLVFYNWVGDMPQSVLDAFRDEYGVTVEYLTFESTEEAVENMRAGQAYDVVVLDNRVIPAVIQEGLLAEIERANVPNLKNIAANFRNLAYDPDNRYIVPYNWGTTGLVVRSDLFEQPVTKWADLWRPELPGKIMLWRGEPRDALGLTLRMLGYSANSEDPDEVEKALGRLMEIRPNVIFGEDYDAESSAPFLADGETAVAMGWSYDALEGRQLNPAIAYVLPEEGALLWADNFVIPANSPQKYTAEVFLNFLLRPEVSAEIVNFNYYATPNEAAYNLIEPEIYNDPVVFPPNKDLKNAEIILPLSLQAQKLYDGVWQRFLEAAP